MEKELLKKSRHNGNKKKVLCYTNKKKLILEDKKKWVVYVTELEQEDHEVMRKKRIWREEIYSTKNSMIEVNKNRLREGREQQL